MFLLRLQVLCSQKDKVIVKDYNYLRHGNMKTKAEMLQFDVDYVLDDSFLPRGNRQRKEESQRRMFEILGKPCVENALDGCNTTVRVFLSYICRRTDKRVCNRRTDELPGMSMLKMGKCIRSFHQLRMTASFCRSWRMDKWDPARPIP